MRLAALLNVLVTSLCTPIPIHAETIPVHYKEGSVHGYLAMRTLGGKVVASGDLIQMVHGDRVVSHLVYRFKDGSIDDDIAVFTQRGVFRLISDRHIQKGPMFPKPMDITIQARTGNVTVRYWEKGQEKVERDHVDLPPDLANGMLLDVIKNVPLGGKETKISYLASTPKPRLITLTAIPDGNDTFRSAGASEKAFRLIIKVDLGGVAGWIAPLIGKQPANSRVWIGAADVPAFIRSEEPLYLGGPILRTELTSPVWK